MQQDEQPQKKSSLSKRQLFLLALASLTIAVVVITLILPLSADKQPTHTTKNTSKTTTSEREPDSARTAQADATKTTTTTHGISKADLGQMLFFDPILSANQSQSCSTCHEPNHAFTDGRTASNSGVPLPGFASMGDDGRSFGNRNTPTATYASTSPKFHYDEQRQEYVGGQFWDGRAATLAEQAGGPPLNPVEMNMPSKQAVVDRLKTHPIYANALKSLYGADVFTGEPEKAYQAMTDAIEQFESTSQFSTYDSKYDKFLRGEYQLTALEDLGRTLFFSEANVNCSNCHVLKREDSAEEPFTNHLYRNIGTPSNPKLIAHNNLGSEYIDHGLLENPNVNDKKYDGKFKVPTLRNVAVTAPYMHNGVFKDLRTVVLFYDKHNNPARKINPETGKPWRQPEVAATVDMNELKSPILTDRKVDALVAFMKILTDERYEPLLENAPDNHPTSKN